MNLVIDNYGHYRLTDHGRGGMKAAQWILFNRRSDELFDLEKGDYDYIKRSISPHLACMEVERWYSGKAKKGRSFDVA